MEINCRAWKLENKISYPSHAVNTVTMRFQFQNFFYCYSDFHYSLPLWLCLCCSHSRKKKNFDFPSTPRDIHKLHVNLTYISLFISQNNWHFWCFYSNLSLCAEAQDINIKKKTIVTPYNLFITSLWNWLESLLKCQRLFVVLIYQSPGWKSQLFFEEVILFNPNIQ